MARSKRYQILDRVKSLLENISVANGFEIDVVTVSTEILDIQNLHLEDCPALCLSIASGGVSTGLTTGTNIESMLNIGIDAFVYTQPGERPVEELDKLLKATEFALRNGTPNTPWNDKYKSVSLNGLTFVYDVSFEEQFNTDEGIMSLDDKGWARWPLAVRFLYSTFDP